MGKLDDPERGLFFVGGWLGVMLATTLINGLLGWDYKCQCPQCGCKAKFTLGRLVLCWLFACPFAVALIGTLLVPSPGEEVLIIAVMSAIPVLLSLWITLREIRNRKRFPRFKHQEQPHTGHHSEPNQPFSWDIDTTNNP